MKLYNKTTSLRVGLFVLIPMALGFLMPNRVLRLWNGLSHTLDSALVGRANAQSDDGPYAAYTEALQEIKKEYYGDPIDAKKNKELTFAAIRGMLYSLNDPFTSFLDPEEWQQMRQTTSGEFEGIGAVLEPFGKDVRVKNPLPDTPAFKAGIKSGDIIMSVGTHNPSTGKLTKTTTTLGKDINDVVKLIKGPRGTIVTITVIRKGANQPLTFLLKRAHIEPPIVRYWMEDKKAGIGHILLNEFNEKSDKQLDKAWTELEKQGMKSLIFDLRYNPGGLLNVAVDIGSRFIDSGPVVIIQEGRGGVRQGLKMRPGQHTHDRIPMVVLANENSASASEIVAGAIKDNETGILMGEHTFGKGLVQTLFELHDGSALRLTTAKYFTPKGNDISNKYDEDHRPLFGTGGIKPDIEVKQSEDWSDQNFDDKKNDTQLQAAIEYLRANAQTMSRK